MGLPQSFEEERSLTGKIEGEKSSKAKVSELSIQLLRLFFWTGEKLTLLNGSWGRRLSLLNYINRCENHFNVFLE